MTPPDLDGLLITGVYGSGKSSVAAEIADLLEGRDISYAAIDLDWLAWFHVPGMDPESASRIYLANVASVASNVRAAGARHLVLAVAVRSRDEVRALEAATGMHLAVVRLVVDGDEIERRLDRDPTTGRREDLIESRRWLDDAIGAGLEDQSFTNESSVQDLAARIIEWLGWTA